MPARTSRKTVSHYPSLGNLRVPPSGMDAVDDGKRANVDAYKTSQPTELQMEKQVDPISARHTGVAETGPTLRNREEEGTELEDALAKAKSDAPGLQAKREENKKEVKELIEATKSASIEPVKEVKAEAKPQVETPPNPSIKPK